MRYIFIAILFIIYFSLSEMCPAQVTQEWVKRYPDTSIFEAGALALVTDDSGNVYVTGYTETSSTMGYCTIKYSSAGDQLWVSNYYGEMSGGRYAYAIALDRSYNVYITGYSFRSGSYFDYCTIKYNSNGVQQWVQYYDGPGHGIDEAQAIAVDNAGNIYVTGFSDNSGGNDYAYATIKYSSDSRQLWVQRYGSNTTYANGIAVDDSCYIYVTGENFLNSVTVKYDSSGVERWVQTYRGLGIGGETVAKSLALDGNSNVYITGYSNNTYTHHDYFTIKYSSAGVQQWVRRFNLDSADGNNEASSIAVDNAGNVYVSGFTSLSNANPMKLTMIKYSNSGDELWIRRDSSTLSKITTYMDIDRSCNVYVAGGWGLSIPHEAYLTLKYDSAGNRQYKIVYYAQDSISDPMSLMLDDKYNIYLTGSSSDFMCTVKYSQVVSVVSNHTQIPRSFKLYQNYPNPFNTSTKIRFDIPVVLQENAYLTRLKVYDILGRVIAVLVDQSMKPGSYEAEWDGSNYSSGIYFYEIVAGRYTETKKMILLK